MTEKIEHRVDRAGWPAGPWDSEPEDRVEWRSQGMPCLTVRNRHGAWCGYVGLTPGHPWYGKDYDSIDAEVHGGLTYGGKCGGPICHVPQPGEPDDVWWLGFDCSHYLDISPRMLAYDLRMGWPREPLAEYRNASWVHDEVERLADQARAAK